MRAVPALLALTLALGCAAPGPDGVLLVTVDTLRADAIGPYGGSVPTPGFDALAAAGVVVEGACTPTPSTGPAHASLFTGLHPWRHGVLRNASPLPDDLPNLASLAREAGIETAGFVSSFNLTGRFGFDRGFAEFRFEPSRLLPQDGARIFFWSRGETATNAALAWLEEVRGRRFFAWVHYFDTHAPYRPGDRFRRPASEPIDATGKSLPRNVASWQQLRELIRAYRGEVAYVDHEIGRLQAGLRELGLLERTALVVTSDHGEGLGDHGWLGHGRNLHDELVVVPLLVRGPGIPAGRRLAGAAQLEDLMPTLLSLLGLPAPQGIDGRDLLPWLRGQVAESPRQAVVGRRADYAGLPDLFFQRRWPEKWIGELEGAGARYQLAGDPREARAAAARAPDALREAAAGPPRRAPERDLDEETRRALEALGYLDADAGGIPE